ncbi:MAG: TRAP transporter small permease subunit [Alphaproteobacteria bacterium]|nr:TRAP transporter small permease subunit [Alphaproteobacteria bacterium]
MADGAERRRSAPLRAFGGLVGGMNAAGTCWIVVLMVLINIEAIGRSAFNTPIIGVIEMIEISIVGIVFLQLADSLRRGVLTRSDGLFNQVMARNPAAGHVMGIVTSALGAGFMGLVLTGSVPFFVDAWQQNYYIGVEGMFTAPVWPIALIIVVAITVTMIQFLIDLADHLRPLIGRG